MMNRLANCHNPYQGEFKKVLCVCSAGLLRSPTMAVILSNPPYNCNTRAAGVATDYALIPMDVALLEWADEIVCASEDQIESVREGLKNKLISQPFKPVYCLDLPDNYSFRDPTLVGMIHTALKRVKFQPSHE